MDFWSSLLALTVAAVMCTGTSAVAAETPDHTTPTKVMPLRLDAAALKDIALTPRPSAPAHIVLGGESRPRSSVVFERDSFVVVVFEEQPLSLALRAPGMPYDEFVHILDGELILTDANGEVQEFKTGASLVIPKGFIGTWEARGNFRELALVSRKDWDATRKPVEPPSP